MAKLPSGVMGKIWLLFFVGFSAYLYRLITPPPPRICGSPNGPPITGPRIKLNDGRFLAYFEKGVPREKAHYKVVMVHGFDGSRCDSVLASQEFLEEHGVYIVSYDRAGYGESDPNPKRSVKSEAFDVENLADALQLGPKFYVMGFSMGGYTVWSCLKYIPHRIAGAALVVPVINYWWPSLPSNLSNEAYYQQLVRDQWMGRIAHHAPRLLYLWLTQKWFPSSSVMEKNPIIFSEKDKELLSKFIELKRKFPEEKPSQNDFESLHRDVMVGFGKWEFDPLEIKENPLSKGTVHIWQGEEDRLVPYKLQRYIAEKLPWIRYHEIAEAGHLLLFTQGMSDAMLKALLLAEELSNLSS
ncbi:hypothetical protein AMTR_s00114p00053290 [Amborella trichopoda]|uniref:AB hydrolase-1 domain-containing protein n=1 Tax=Amborella trichopoda TaxID=13333 RepID=W1NTQ1_AMBTC|nr:hypothetical protein AMTR_s00114p00053290 [Amborella trichopoda]